MERWAGRGGAGRGGAGRSEAGRSEAKRGGAGRVERVESVFGVLMGDANYGRLTLASRLAMADLNLYIFLSC